MFITKLVNIGRKINSFAICSLTNSKKEDTVQTTTNPSIGAIGAPYNDATNSRVKGFFPRILNSIQAVHQTLETVPTEADRTTIRVITDETVSKKLLWASTEHFHCEAMIPIQGIGNIVYYGHNRPVRQTAQSIRVQQRRLLEGITMRNSRQDQLSPGFSICTHIAGTVPQLRRNAAKIAEIYQLTFNSYLVELDQLAVLSMLASNRVVAIQNSHGIVAVVMAEVATIDIGSRKLRLAEISEVATHPEYQRQGLSRFAYRRIVNDLQADGVDVIFSETRANHYGIMAVAWDSGLKPRGMLEQHCVISSNFEEVSQTGRFGDLVVFSL